MTERVILDGADEVARAAEVFSEAVSRIELIDAPNAHDALGDVRVTAALLAELING